MTIESFKSLDSDLKNDYVEAIKDDDKNVTVHVNETFGKI